MYFKELKSKRDKVEILEKRKKHDQEKVPNGRKFGGLKIEKVKVDEVRALNDAKGGGAYPTNLAQRDNGTNLVVVNSPTPTTSDAEYIIPVLPKIKDQMGVNACVAFTLATCREILEYYQRKIANPNSTFDINDNPISPAFIYANRSSSDTQEEYMYFAQALAHLKNEGVVFERQFPFRNENYSDSKYNLNASKPELLTLAKQNKIYSYGNTLTASTIKSHLINNRPVLGGMTVGMSDFMDTIDGFIPSPQVDTEKFDHALTIVGWVTKNAKQYWIMMNSWGTGYGDGGFFYVPIGHPDLDYMYYMTDTQTPTNTVVAELVCDGSFVPEGSFLWEVDYLNFASSMSSIRNNPSPQEYWKGDAICTLKVNVPSTLPVLNPKLHFKYKINNASYTSSGFTFKVTVNGVEYNLSRTTTMSSYVDYYVPLNVGENIITLLAKDLDANWDNYGYVNVDDMYMEYEVEDDHVSEIPPINTLYQTVLGNGEYERNSVSKYNWVLDTSIKYDGASSYKNPLSIVAGGNSYISMYAPYIPVAVAKAEVHFKYKCECRVAPDPSDGSEFEIYVNDVLALKIDPTTDTGRNTNSGWISEWCGAKVDLVSGKNNKITFKYINRTTQEVLKTNVVHIDDIQVRYVSTSVYKY